MNQGKYVFSQLTALISHTSFKSCVDRYQGNYKVKDFSCWRQFLCMAFGQLTQRDSLSDTILCLNANGISLYHLGLGGKFTKSALSKANANRDWKIFADLTMLLIDEARALYVGESDLDVELQNNVFAIDATVIDLCFTTFWWATFRTTKSGIKVHTQLDLKTSIPEFIYITTASTHEVNVLDLITFLPDSFYVLDRGYTDFERLHRIHRSNAFFIIRAKDNLDFRRLSSRSADKRKGVRSDFTIRLNGFYPAKWYPDKLRRIRFYDKEHHRMLVFLTNNFEVTASDIAQLYKHRWKIELFFKWIKQHLKIKSFWGQTENAVKTQIWIAIATYTLVAIAKKKFNLKQSLYEILQVVSIHPFSKTPIQELFQTPINQDFKERLANQLNIFE